MAGAVRLRHDLTLSPDRLAESCREIALPTQYTACAELIHHADGLLITAGAGMGVDSGLPDFRGTQGFWRAYPALGRAKIPFEDIANPAVFESNPRLAWGFYGHRLNLYRATVPHEGFHILRRLSEHMHGGHFVFTSNVDGQFQKAGFGDEQIMECHGSIHNLQCLSGCTNAIWTAEGFDPVVDEANCLLTSPLPTCPYCGGLARPNILMFSDWGWLDKRTNEQQRRLRSFLDRVDRLLVIEIGAGTNIPTVRRQSESLAEHLIRINPTEPGLGRAAGVSIACTGLSALRSIENATIKPGAPA